MKHRSDSKSTSGEFDGGQPRRRTAFPLALTLALAIFLLWMVPSTDSRYQRSDGADFRAIRHEVALGVLGYGRVEATRSDPASGWSTRLDLRPDRLGLTLLLSLPLLALGRMRDRIG